MPLIYLLYQYHRYPWAGKALSFNDYHPPHAPSHHSSCLQALSNAPIPNHSVAFLSAYSAICNTHNLFPTDLSVEGAAMSVDDIPTALGDGFLEPSIDPDNKPSWAQAMASSEWEYWIAASHNGLWSLEDLKVFVLVPHSKLTCRQCPLKGKLASRTTLERLFITKSVMLLKVLHSTMASSTTRQLCWPSDSNHSTQSFTLLPACTGAWNNLTSKPPSFMEYYLKTKPCLWSNLLVQGAR